MTTLHGMIIEVIQYISQNQSILDQGINWLMKWFNQKLNSSALNHYKRLFNSFVNNKNVSQDLIVFKLYLKYLISTTKINSQGQIYDSVGLETFQIFIYYQFFQNYQALLRIIYSNIGKWKNS
ncbi:unnamed protein product [Paramecium sonneborni]|uniref:Uncharacterized protein n=1 Tax=Paramecium sonneborni TaxID=65129 RepID=A0A8S1RTG3_9CILI|nr:unnamed protein product [Paramecium sonneborni]